MKAPNLQLELLRQKAEYLFFNDKNSINNQDNLDAMEVRKIFHELQVQQLELEMQNDELQTTTIELEQQKMLLSSLFELAPIGYFITDKTGIIKDVNQTGCKLLGTNKYKLLNKPFLLKVHPDDYDLFYVYIRKLVLAGNSKSIQIRLLDEKKNVYFVQIEGIAIHPASANTQCYLTVTDLTERIQAAEKLNTSNQTLEIALNASSTGIWEINIETGEILLDNYCCSLFGVEFDDFDQKYQTLLHNIHPTDRKNVDTNIRKTLIDEQELNIKFRVNLTDKNSIRYIQARAQVIRDQKDKKRFIGTFTDITEKTLIELEAIRIKKEHEQMILAAGLQAEENEKKRISEVLHDGIAQMLYAIKLNVDQLKPSAPAPIYEQVNELLKQSIKDIRNISFELLPSILADFGLASTLEDLAARLSNPQLYISTKVNNISKSLNVQLQLNLFRIIQELINNSIKHGNANKITVEVTKTGKIINVTVSDNGSGFVTADDTGIPNGIGLSSIKNRLRLYKGSLKIESSPNAGTSVYVSLKH